MLREHAKLFTTLQFVTDLLLSAAAFPVAYLTRQQLDRFVPGEVERLLNPVLLPLQSYLWMVFLALPLWALAAYSLGLYRLSFRPSDWEKIRIGAVTLAEGVYLLKIPRPFAPPGTVS